MDAGSPSYGTSVGSCGYGMLDKGKVYMTLPVRPETIATRPTRAARCAPHSHAMPAYARTREVSIFIW